MLGSFAAATGIGFALAPADSAQYWTGTVFDYGRVGNLAYAGNQSLRGMAARLFSTAATQTTVWVFAALVVLGLGVVAMRRCLRAGNTTFALLINAQVGLLVSPISWSHHWIWIAPALLALLTHGRDGPTRPPFVIGGVLTLAFVTAPHWTLPYKFDGQLNWAIWQQVPGNLYVILGLARRQCHADAGFCSGMVVGALTSLARTIPLGVMSTPTSATGHPCRLAQDLRNIAIVAHV
jgi:alpha-1,2-mannosyltransferase